MPMTLHTAGTVEELRALLIHLPLDAEQRDSVSGNLDLLEVNEAGDLLENLQGTLASLTQTTQEIEGLLAALDVQVTRDTAPAMAFEMSLCDPA